MTLIRRFWMEEEGADATEYALLAALIAVAIIGGATTLGGGINNLFMTLAGTIGS